MMNQMSGWKIADQQAEAD